MIGCLTAVTTILLFLSITAYLRDRSRKAGAICIALGLFFIKNIALTFLYLKDELPTLNLLMFFDVVVVGFVLVTMTIRESSKTHA